MRPGKGMERPDTAYDGVCYPKIPWLSNGFSTIQTAIFKNHVRSNTPIFTVFFSTPKRIEISPSFTTILGLDFIVFSFWRVAITACLEFFEGQPPKINKFIPVDSPKLVDSPTVKKNNIYKIPLTQQIYSKHVTIHFLPSGNLT